MTSGEKVRQSADLVVRIFREEMKIDLTFDRVGVAFLNDFIEQNRADWRPDSETAVNNFGCFFGECLRRNFNGVWSDDDNQSDFRLVIGEQVSVFPFACVRSQIDGVEDESILGVFDSLARPTEPGRECDRNASDDP
jgi:hypothetical protein